MQDGVEAHLGAPAEPPQQPAQIPPALVMPPRRRSSGKTIVLTALLAFLIGGGAVGWLVHDGRLDAFLPGARKTAAPVQTVLQSPDAAAQQGELGGVETRLALMEERFSRIDREAKAASANASRAEALLIALAARRMIEKGQPLGYLENQLKLRFGGAQPQAVQTVIDAAKAPVTLYGLSSELEAAAPALSGERRNESTWATVSREFASLFVVRRTSSPALQQFDRVERAQVLLKAGQIDDAIAEVERLPGAEDAQDWITAARRYAEVQRALEIIETSALLQPRDLRDGEGLAVSQPSPLDPAPEEAAQVN